MDSTLLGQTQVQVESIWREREQKRLKLLIAQEAFNNYDLRYKELGWLPNRPAGETSDFYLGFNRVRNRSSYQA